MPVLFSVNKRFLRMLVFLISLLAPFIILKLYLKFKTKWCKSKTCLLGKTVIVTGANTGIGFEAALNFAMRGAKVILACRDAQRAKAAQQKIVDLTNNHLVYVKLIDMSSIKSIRSFVDDIKKCEERLDILVNNAGTAGLKSKRTQDNLEIIMQINYFGPYLLTILLIDLLKKSAPSRIVNVSSLLAKYGKLDTDNLNKYMGTYITYANSKLCNIFFTKELACRLKSSNVTAYSVHPGAVQTEIFKRVTGLSKVILDFFYNVYFKTAEEGAQTIIYSAVEKNIESFSGNHFHECKPVTPYKTASNVSLQQKVWEITEELIGLEPEEKFK